jgi:hypothetical protein
MLHAASSLVLVVVVVLAVATSVSQAAPVPVPGEGLRPHLSSSERVEHFVVGGVDSFGDTAKGVVHGREGWGTGGVGVLWRVHVHSAPPAMLHRRCLVPPIPQLSTLTPTIPAILQPASTPLTARWVRFVP